MVQFTTSSTMCCSSARWVAREVTLELEERWVNACQELLQQCEREGDGFLKHVMMRWKLGLLLPAWNKEGAIPGHQNPKISTHRIVLPVLFWDHQGPIIEHYMSKGTAVTSTSYCNMLRNHVRPAIRSKHHGPLDTGVSLLHDNARPRTTHWQLRR
jgi:hypothetical protein